MVSRQRDWQLRQLAAGRCQGCGQAPLFSEAFCQVCLLKYRVRNRIRTKAKPWVRGKAGRPPVEAKE